MLDAKNTKDFPHFSLRQVNASFESEITKRKISTFDFPFFHFYQHQTEGNQNPTSFSYLALQKQLFLLR